MRILPQYHEKTVESVGTATLIHRSDEATLTHAERVQHVRSETVVKTAQSFLFPDLEQQRQDSLSLLQ
jgi:hypothetical protein